jgi:K+-sensing histidine kinase KdpD
MRASPLAAKTIGTTPLEKRPGLAGGLSNFGPGIAAADFPRVLGRFYRGDSSRQSPGTGLGLSLVASVGRLHGFGLKLLSVPAGCCIELECWQDAAGARSAAPPPETS